MDKHGPFCATLATPYCYFTMHCNILVSNLTPADSQIDINV